MSASIPNVGMLEQIIGYSFTNQNHGRDALYAAGALYTGHDGNKVGAMLGDSLIDTIILRRLISSGRTRGDMNNTVKALVHNTNLANVCHATGIDSLMIKNPAQRFEAINTTTASATVEAVVAAVFIDSDDLDVTESVMTTLGLVIPGNNNTTGTG